ncbi:prepilin-type N-terminal cleavage/methylation domain-containing protein [Rhodanobacter lindaniclasticus]
MRFGIRDSGFGKARKRHVPALAPAFPNPESRTPNPGRAPRANGFTLLEVIAAIALLAIAFTVLMRVAGGAIRLSENAADHSEAALWARSLLDTAFTDEPVRAGSTSGRFDQRFGWRLDVTPWRPGATPTQVPLQLYQLDLEVSWGPATHPHAAHFRTLRLAGAGPGQTR